MLSVPEIISAAFVMGLFGSLHCIGMCGPLALALPMSNRSQGGRLFGGIIYNSGRMFTYTVLGLLLGLAGDFLISPQLQSSVSIVLGAVLLLYLFLPKSIKHKVSAATPASHGLVKLREQLGRLLSIQTNSSLFGIGMLNGLLPCGMIYLALTSSFLTGSSTHAGLFMFAFGLGTFPAMVSVVVFSSYLNQHFRQHLRKLVPVFLFSMAALLVLRGLNLGIPYISPALPSATTPAVVCH